MVFEAFVKLVLSGLAIFKSDMAIGLIAVAMLICASVVIMSIQMARETQLQCLSAVRGALLNGFADSKISPDLRLKDANIAAFSHDFPEFERAWREYYSSIVHDTTSLTFTSPIAPSSVFSNETLGFSTKAWGRSAGLFVSVGLVLTFMGLVAALQQSGAAIVTAGGSESDIKHALSELLQVVSSKFILSITGLSCSIAINLFIDRREQFDRLAIAKLNEELNNFIAYQPIEEVFFDMRALLRQQLAAIEDRK
jgi:hypothetical protein